MLQGGAHKFAGKSCKNVHLDSALANRYECFIMRKLHMAVIFLGLAHGAAADSLGPCTTTTLDQLIGSQGCVSAGGFVFSNFSYTTQLVSGGTDVPASAVTVTFHQNGGLTFSSNWNALSISGASFQYNVAFPTGFAPYDPNFSSTAWEAMGSGVINMSMTNGVLLWTESALAGGASATNRSDVFFPGITVPSALGGPSLFTVNTSFIQTGPDYYFLSLRNDINGTPAPTAPVPEPATMLLFASGLVPLVRRFVAR